MITNNTTNSGLDLFQNRVLSRLNDSSLYATWDLQGHVRTNVYYSLKTDSLVTKGEFGDTVYLTSVYSKQYREVSRDDQLKKLANRIKRRAPHILSNLGKGDPLVYSLDAVERSEFKGTTALFDGTVLPWDINPQKIEDTFLRIVNRDHIYSDKWDDYLIFRAASHEWMVKNHDTPARRQTIATLGPIYSNYKPVTMDDVRSMVNDLFAHMGLN